MHAGDCETYFGTRFGKMERVSGCLNFATFLDRGSRGSGVTSVGPLDDWDPVTYLPSCGNVNK